MLLKKTSIRFFLGGFRALGAVRLQLGAHKVAGFHGGGVTCGSELQVRHQRSMRVSSIGRTRMEVRRLHAHGIEIRAASLHSCEGAWWLQWPWRGTYVGTYIASYTFYVPVTASVVFNAIPAGVATSATKSVMELLSTKWFCESR
ncbi:hypothetical protein GUJ93_ZPchr0003g18520 [Zizania palustris]|uniref:Uncharacterized protein n=1 Tax=Zizania palustris TaxID=103762 RepID=A0A8J5SEZ5_ZIZPA|nr:hypothetical protein GUJ93_ZPchr0003g18520 [Zizania palustris]